MRNFGIFSYCSKITIYYKVPYSKENLEITKRHRMQWNPDEKLWSFTTNYNGTDEDLYLFVFEELPHIEFDAAKINLSWENKKHTRMLFKEIKKIQKKLKEREQKRNEETELEELKLLEMELDYKCGKISKEDYEYYIQLLNL